MFSLVPLIDSLVEYAHIVQRDIVATAVKAVSFVI